jgi:hypothetical protein
MATGIQILEPAFSETARENGGAFNDMLAERRTGRSPVDRMVENLPGEEQRYGRSALSFGAATRPPVEATRFIAGGKSAATKGVKYRCDEAWDRLSETLVLDIRDAGRKAVRIAERDTVLVDRVLVCLRK